MVDRDLLLWIELLLLSSDRDLEWGGLLIVELRLRVAEVGVLRISYRGFRFVFMDIDDKGRRRVFSKLDFVADDSCYSILESIINVTYFTSLFFSAGCLQPFINNDNILYSNHIK